MEPQAAGETEARLVMQGHMVVNIHGIFFPPNCYLDYRHAGADIDEQVGENVGLRRLEAELRVGVFGVDEGLVWDVPQHKVAAFDQAGHLILFVHAAGEQQWNTVFLLSKCENLHWQID